RRHPVAIEIEKHDGTVAETVGGQNLHVSARLAHRMASALMAMASLVARGWCPGRRRWTFIVWGRASPAAAQSRPTKMMAGPVMARWSMASVRSRRVAGQARSSGG